MYSYRITKYHQRTQGNKYLTSPVNEWTDYSDVGTLVSLDDYLIVEHEFIRIITAICDELNLHNLNIVELEIRADSSLSIPVVESESIQRNQLMSVLKMLLRREIWGKLVADNVQFHFGYDYYMYCVSSTSLDQLFNLLDSFLNIESFRSPYLDSEL